MRHDCRGDGRVVATVVRSDTLGERTCALVQRCLWQAYMPTAIVYVRYRGCVRPTALRLFIQDEANQSELTRRHGPHSLISTVYY